MKIKQIDVLLKDKGLDDDAIHRVSAADYDPVVVRQELKPFPYTDSQVDDLLKEVAKMRDAAKTGNYPAIGAKQNWFGGFRRTGRVVINNVVETARWWGPALFLIAVALGIYAYRLEGKAAVAQLFQKDATVEIEKTKADLKQANENAQKAISEAQRLISQADAKEGAVAKRATELDAKEEDINRREANLKAQKIEAKSAETTLVSTTSTITSVDSTLPKPKKIEDCMVAENNVIRTDWADDCCDRLPSRRMIDQCLDHLFSLRIKQ